MATAFQPNAFQNNAFQIDVVILSGQDLVTTDLDLRTQFHGKLVFLRIKPTDMDLL